jgi:RimJ/RimL family protein N-acetyltransferase
MLTVTEKLLTDGIVSLREISPNDSEILYRWRMGPLSRPMFRNTEVVSYEAHESMIQKYFRADTKDCWFIIETAQKPVGTVALYNFDDHGRTSEWGRFVIAPELRGLGFGRRALRLLMEYAETSGVRSVHCEVLSTNVVALNLYRDFGFVERVVREDGGRSFVELAIDLIGCI